MTSPWRGTRWASLTFFVTVAAVVAGFYLLPPIVAGGLAAVGVAVAVGSLGIEFKLTGDDHTCILRLPVAPGAEADAERVVRHFEANRIDR